MNQEIVTSHQSKSVLGDFAPSNAKAVYTYLPSVLMQCQTAVVRSDLRNATSDVMPLPLPVKLT